MSDESGTYQLTPAESAARQLINNIMGMDAWPASLAETPRRFSEAWNFWTSGYSQHPAEVLKVFEEEGIGDGMIFQGSIPVYSKCEHHLADMFGVAHIGYIPDKGIVGLSKFSRLVEIFARRLTVQERLGQQIADAFMEHVKPKGVGVIVQLRHMCMESRGIRVKGAVTSTSVLKGLFMNDAEVREEFFTFARLGTNVAPL